MWTQRPSVYFLLYFTSRDATAVLGEGISMKLGTRYSSSDWALLKGFSRSAVKGQGHSDTNTLLWRKHTYRRLTCFFRLFILTARIIAALGNYAQANLVLPPGEWI